MDGLRCHVTRKPEIFCNTELHMAQINAIGFDMDYTLAQYLPSLDLLAYEGTKQKLVANMGYPAPVSQLVYDFNNCRRGCVIHIKRGNVLKLDQYRYLRAVQHGLTAMSADSRKAMYRESYQEAESFTPPDYINIDTLFDVVAACLYAQLVEMRDQCDLGLLGSASEQDFFRRKSYEQLWHDMSKCLSQCHRDGAIKHTVAQNPKDYIVYDPMRKPIPNSLTCCVCVAADGWIADLCLQCLKCSSPSKMPARRSSWSRTAFGTTRMW